MLIVNGGRPNQTRWKRVHLIYKGHRVSYDYDDDDDDAGDDSNKNKPRHKAVRCQRCLMLTAKHVPRCLHTRRQEMGPLRAKLVFDLFWFYFFFR